MPVNFDALYKARNFVQSFSAAQFTAITCKCRLLQIIKHVRDSNKNEAVEFHGFVTDNSWRVTTVLAASKLISEKHERWRRLLQIDDIYHIKTSLYVSKAVQSKCWTWNLSSQNSQRCKRLTITMKTTVANKSSQTSRSNIKNVNKRLKLSRSHKLKTAELGNYDKLAVMQCN